MFGSKKTNEEIERLRQTIEIMTKKNAQLEERVKELMEREDDSYKNYPKIDFLTKAYSSILRDLKKQSDAMILATKYASEHIIRNDIDMLNTDAILARSFSKVLKMTDQEVADEIRETITEDTDTGTLAFKDAHEFESVRNYGFRNNVMIRDVILPEGIEKIKRGFFYACTSLKKVRIPDSVEYIDDYAFFGCDSLKKVEFSGGGRLKSIGEYAFSSCRSLTGIALPDRLTQIGAAAFRECSGLKTVTMPLGRVEKIGNHAFQNCISLTGMDLPYKLNLIQTSLFKGCAALKELSVPEGVELVMDYAFDGCGSLEKLDFQSGSTQAAKFAFTGVPDRTAITVKGSPIEREPALEQTAEVGELLKPQEN